MPRKKGWKEAEKKYGIVTIHANSWSSFLDFVDNLHTRTQRNSQFIWRGQRCSSWTLRTSLDRILINKGMIQKGQRSHLSNSKRRDGDEYFLLPNLNAFKYSARGRRGPNPPAMTTDNDWWALGQHHGLNTPLLDWTCSPYVACFFAFANTGIDQTNDRVVYALWEEEVNSASERITNEWKELSRSPILEFVRPLSDENPRLVSQSGLFTRGPVGMDLEDWIRANFSKEHHYYVLIRILLPNKERKEILRSLNRMNINHLSLFPDISGSTNYCNRMLDDPGYGIS